MFQTYKFLIDEIYEDQWKGESNKAICKDGSGFSWILLYPGIPEGEIAEIWIRSWWAWGNWCVGITREDIMKTHKTFLGHSKIDWSFSNTG